jgi:hypothetical protein
LRRGQELRKCWKRYGSFVSVEIYRENGFGR